MLVSRQLGDLREWTVDHVRVVMVLVGVIATTLSASLAEEPFDELLREIAPSWRQ